MRTKLSQAEFYKSGITIENEYTLKNIEEMKSFVKEVNNFYPCEIVFEISEHDGKIYFEHAKAKLKSDLDLYILPKGYTKRYHVACYNHYKDISNYQIRDVRESIEAPKNMGVLSTKKIQAWVSYEERVHAKLTELSKKHSSEVADFLKSLEGLDVEFWGNGKNGSFRKGGLRFEFNISDGYIEKRIKLDIDESASLDVFLKLTDNQYKK